MHVADFKWADGSAIAVIAGTICGGLIAAYRWLRASILRGAEPELDKLRDLIYEERDKINAARDKESHRIDGRLQRLENRVSRLTGDAEADPRFRQRRDRDSG